MKDNNFIEKEILNLFVNEYNNIDEISIKLNIKEDEITKILDKYNEVFKGVSFADIYIK